MTPSAPPSTRHLGLLGATGVGIGAIGIGAILALAGVAFATTGPSAILAFALNGVVAMLTAVSFAELASRFPESGGTYTYARKVLTVEAAFAVGWVVWFASVVAAVLYALGFAVFLVPFLEQVVRVAGGSPPSWLGGRFALLGYALGAVAFYAWSLARSTGGGGQWATIGKVVLFGIILGGGFWVLLTSPPSTEELAARFSPFLESGGSGLVQAMGYTFIALQGFDLIAAVGGEVKNPEKNIPRAMFLSLGTALVIYLPLLFLVVAVGTPGQGTAEAARENPEIFIAVAARSFMGPTGYWLVVVAGVLSMLSALQANLLAASRFARTMASDRTLPWRFERLSVSRGTPVAAIKLSAAAAAFVLVAVPDVAGAGAMSGLIFLMSFTVVHGIAYLARSRAGVDGPFQAPAFPMIPAVGGAACLALGLFQAFAVPSAGALAALWRPDTWPEEGLPPQLVGAQAILGDAMSTALAEGLSPETLITIHDDPWGEIARIARLHRCESILLGVGQKGASLMTGPVEELLGQVDADVMILRAPPDWDLSTAHRLLVPSGGARFQSSMRARLLGSLSRTGDREVTFLRTIAVGTDAAVRRRAEQELERLAHDEAPGISRVVVTPATDLLAEVARHAAESDLLILGLERRTRGRPAFGRKVLGLVAATQCPVLMISQRA